MIKKKEIGPKVNYNSVQDTFLGGGTAYFAEVTALTVVGMLEG